MTEDEYFASEPSDNDDDIIYEFLIDEPEDLTLLMLPKLKFSIPEEAEKYYKLFKKCRNKAQMIQLLIDFGSTVAQMTLLKSDIQYLQDRAKELEFNVKMLQNQ